MADDSNRTDMIELARKVALGWKDALLGLSFFLGLALIYLHVATYQYTATVEMVSTQPQSQSSLGQLGGLAAAAGINLPSLQQSVSPFTLYPDALLSSSVADELARKNPEIMQHLFRAQWDDASKSWKQPSGLTASVVAGLKSVFTPGAPAWSPPGGEQLQDIINDRVFVQSDLKKPLVTVTFRDPDPEFAKHFLIVLNETTDLMLRRMTLARSSQYARYLEDKLGTVQLSELREVLMSTLSVQETLIMMSSSSTPFAAQMLGPVRSSLRPTSPNPLLVLLLAMSAGAAIGLTASFWGVSIYDGVRHLRSGSQRRAARRLDGRNGFGTLAAQPKPEQKQKE